MFRGFSEAVITIIFVVILLVALLSGLWKSMPGFLKVIIVIVGVGNALGIFKRS